MWSGGGVRSVSSFLLKAFVSESASSSSLSTFLGTGNGLAWLVVVPILPCFKAR